MAINLTIDQGNSAAKLALWIGDKLLDLSIETCLTPQTLGDFLTRNNQPGVHAAIYCSVAGNGNDLTRWLSAHTTKVLKLTGETPVPVKIAYKTPLTLGADRIAASVGAWHLFPGTDLLVVDAGTAVTYDWVNSQGHFMGGNIAPGMRMRLDALHRYTARLPRLEVPRNLADTPVFGNDTQSAMISGAVFGIVGALSYYRSQLPENAQVVITGGWAEQLSKLCNFPAHIDHHLVSRGLNRILQYNENK